MSAPHNVSAEKVQLTIHNWPRGMDAFWFGFCFAVGLTTGAKCVLVLGKLINSLFEVLV